MSRFPKSFGLFWILGATCASFLFIASAAATDRFVATTGTDTGDCSNSGSPCLTLGYAVGQAVGGDRVIVAAGTYNMPSVVDINKQLELRGAQADVDARTRTPSNESILTGPNGVLSASADGIIINGFTIEGQTDTLLNGGAVWFKDTFSGYQFLNNIVQDNVYGVYGNSSGTQQSVLRFNLFQNNNAAGAGSGNGIYSDYGSHDILIDSNLFVGNDSCGVNYDTFQEDNTDLTVTNNRFEQNGGGVCIQNTDGLIIRTNEIVDSVVTGIGINGDVTAAVIEDNLITGAGTRAVVVRDAFDYGPNDDIEITMNQIVANGGGIEIGTGGITAVGEFHFNRIFDNAKFGLSNASALSVDAENNWWGCNAGPNDAAGDCDTVSGPADFDPWLILRLLADPTTLPAGDSSALTADLLQNSDGVDTMTLGNIPDDTPVTFASAVGSVNPAAAVTASGQAASSFTPDATIGTKQVCTTVDNQTVCVDVQVVAAPIPTPTPTPVFLGCLEGSGNLGGGTGSAACTGFACSLHPEGGGEGLAASALLAALLGLGFWNLRTRRMGRTVPSRRR